MSGGVANGQRWVLVLSPDGAARDISLHCAKAFQNRFTDRVKTFDSLTFRSAFSRLQKHENDEMTVDLLNQSLIVSCLDFSVTHVLVMALSPVTLFTLNLLRKQGIKTAHWFFEDFRRATYWKDVLSGYDHFCAIQRGPLPAACRAAGSEFHFLPTATILGSRVPRAPHNPSDRVFDIGFVGIPSPYRIAILESLVNKGLKVAIGGYGWNAYKGVLQKSIINTQWVGEEESFEILQRSKTGINLSIDEPIDRELTHISPRVYDILAAGCALVSEEVPLLSESLRGCSYHTFISAENAFEVIQKAVSTADSADFKNALEKNRQNVLNEHTFARRVEKLVDLVV